MSTRRSAMRFRGSLRRVRRIRFRDNWSRDMWLVVALVIVVLLVLFPWFVTHQLQ
jgi:hypothetical protein